MKKLHSSHHHKSVGHDVRHKLEEKVKAAGMHERFIAHDVEKELVSYAVEHGLEADFAENVVGAISVEKGFVLESSLDHILTVILKHLGKKKGGKVDHT